MKAHTDVQARRAGVHPKNTVERPPRPPRWRWAVPRDDLKRLLGQGLGPSEIARRYGLNHSTVGRAIRALEHQDLVAVVLGNRCQPSLSQIPPPTVDAPIDVMGEVRASVHRDHPDRSIMITEIGIVITQIGPS
jgi:hypothetical protein